MSKTIGIISSAGGSAIFEIYPYLESKDIKLVVATDRQCGIETLCGERGVLCRRFSYGDKETFSREVGSFFQESSVEDLVFLYYTRFVSNEIFDGFNALNFHPSILPLFSGLKPIEMQLEQDVSLIGATVHKVDGTCDGGPIIGQIANSFLPETVNKTSFMQKIFLALAAIDLYLSDQDFCSVKSRSVKFLNTNMFLSDESLVFFQSLEEKHQMKILGVG